MNNAEIAKVVSVSGQAYARNAEGELREITAGSSLLEGETVVTPNGARVELELADATTLIVDDAPELTLTADLISERAATREESALAEESVEDLMVALEEGRDIGDALEAPGAGSGSAGAEGSSFVRLARIAQEAEEFTEVQAATAGEDLPVLEQIGFATDQNVPEVEVIEEPAPPPVQPPAPAPTPSLTISDDQVSEGNVAVITINLSFASDEAVSVNFATDDRSATITGGDYVANSGVVVFAPGETSKTILITTNEDSLEEGTEQLVVTLSDPSNAVIADGQGTVTIADNDGTITPPSNSSPIAQNDSATTLEGTPVTIAVLGNDTDPDGDTVSVTVVGNPANGTIVLNSDNTVEYTPNENYTGGDSFTYTISDGLGGTDTATVNIVVSADINTFTDANEVVSTSEDSPVSGSVLSGTSSVEGPVTVSSFSIAGDPATYAAGDTATIIDVGTLSLDADGSYTFAPVPNYNGPVPVATYTMSDGVTLNETSTLRISVAPQTDGFADANEVVSTNEDTPVSGSVLTGTNSVDGPVIITGFSVDGDITNYIAGDTATIIGVGTLTIDLDGGYSFTPEPDYNGPVPVATYTVSDGVTMDETSTLTISVTPQTDLFTDANEVVSTNEDTAVSGNVLIGTSSVEGPVTITGFAIDGDPATYAAGDTATITDVGTLTIGVDGAYTFTPEPNYNGPVPVTTYTASDGVTTDETSTLTISVTPQTDSFSDANEVVSTNEDTAVSGSVLTGTSSVEGPVTVTGFVVDGDLTPYSAGDTATIIDVGTLTIGIDGSYTFTPEPNYNGPVPVTTYTVSDSVTTDETSTLTISVTPQTDGLTDASEVVSTNEDTSISGSLLTGTTSVDGPVEITGFQVAGDLTPYAAGDTATITDVGTLTIGLDGSYIFTPEPNYSGPVPVATYTVSDGVTTNETSTLTISVTPQIDGFTDANEVVSTNEDTAVSGSVLIGTSSLDGPVAVTGFTVEGDVSLYVAGDTATITDVGTLTIGIDGSYTFTPEPDYTGPVPVATYTISDGVTTGETSTLTISVTPQTDGFADANELVSTNEDSPVSGSVLTGTSSVDGPVTVTGFTIDGDLTPYAAGDVATIDDVGTLMIAVDGSYIFTPEPNYNGPVPVATYTVSDGVTTNETSTLTISVTPQTDGFTDANEIVSTNEDTPVSGSVLTGTSSVDGAVEVTGFVVDGDLTPYAAGDTATITDVGTLTIGVDGGYTFTPEPNYNGPVPVATYTVGDGVTIDETSTLAISVIPQTDGLTDADEIVSTNEDTLISGSVLTGTSSLDGPVTITGFEVVGDLTPYAAGDTATITDVGTLTIGVDGSYIFTPEPDYNGPVPVATYTVTDGVTTDETSTLTISVNPQTDGLTDANEVVNTNEDTPISGSVLTGTSSVDGPVTITGFAIDGDLTAYAAGDTATITDVGTLTIGVDGNYTFTPEPDYSGPVPIATYTVSDGVTTDETSTLTVSVTPQTDGFADADEIVSTNEDTSITDSVLTGTSSVDGPVTITGFQIDGDLTPYAAGDTATITDVGTLTIGVDGSYTFTPEPNYSGPVPVATYTVSDGITIDETSTLTISVSPQTDGFTDADEVVSTVEDTPVSGSVLTGTTSVDGPVEVTGFTIDGDITPYAAGDIAIITDVGTLSIGVDGSYTFTPDDSYSGPVPTATYTLSDGVTTNETSTLSIAVTPVANTPMASISIGEATVVTNSGVQSINATLGSAAGDGVLQGTPDFDYDETVSTTIDFGSGMAGQTVMVNLDITVNGSWNHDGIDEGVYDDNWGVSVNGTQTAVFYYNGTNTSTMVETDLGGGLTEFRFGDPGADNTNINFSHSPTIEIVLDENGRAELEFGAQTTQTSEIVTINGLAVIDPPDTFNYGIDLTAALVDVDGSEDLSVIVRVPDSGVLTSNNPNIAVTNNGSGEWSVTSVPAGSNSFGGAGDELTLSMQEGELAFAVQIEATATDTGGAPESITTIETSEIVIPTQSVVEASGSDETLIATMDSDVFAWTLADAGTAGSPDSDVITGFGDLGNDVLDLRDLLVGEESVPLSLDSYFSVSEVSGSTVINISTAGEFLGDAGDSARVDQIITLDGVSNASLDTGVGSIIEDMLSSGKLVVDQ